MREKRVLVLMVAGMLLGGVSVRADETRPVALVPQPLRMEYKTGTFVLKKDSVILVDKNSADALAVGTRLAERLKVSTGLALRVSPTDGTAPVHNAILLPSIFTEKNRPNTFSIGVSSFRGWS